MSKVEETYLYSVMNRGPIKLSRGIEIRSARSLYLTKEDVIECLKKAHVYRRFGNPPGKQEMVTTANIDRLHRANYISEEDWKKISENNAESAKIEDIVEVPVVEEIEKPIVIEEIINTEPETEETIEEPEKAAELTSVEVEETEEQETLIEESVNDNIVPDVIIEENGDNVDDEQQPTDDEILANTDNKGKFVTTEMSVESLEEIIDSPEVQSENSESQSQTNTVKYNYHKKNKNHKK